VKTTFTEVAADLAFLVPNLLANRLLIAVRAAYYGGKGGATYWPSIRFDHNSGNIVVPEIANTKQFSNIGSSEKSATLADRGSLTEIESFDERVGV
jgi:hypothetical protein